MPLAPWIRDTLWRAPSWRTELTRLATEVSATRAWELGQALEYVEPDRSRALAMYMLAWRDGQHVEAHTRARTLAAELRAYETLGELALDDYRTSALPADLVLAAAAFVDGGLPARAEDALARAVEIPSVALEAKSLRAIARREVRDPHREISHYVSRAQQGRDDSVRMFVHAARLARATGLDPMHANVLAGAVKRWPKEPAIAALVEDRLLARGHADELLAHYRVCFDAASGSREWVERMCGAAMELVARGVQPALGLRLLRRALEHAHGARLVDVPRHLAVWELLVSHAREAQTTRELVPLIMEALALPLGDDDRVYLASLALEIAWRDAGDAEAAKPYAAMVGELVPDHPAVRALIAMAMPELAPEPELLADDLVDDDEPGEVTSAPPPDARRLVVPPPVPPPRASLIPAAALEAMRRTKPGMPLAPSKANVPERATRTVIPIDVRFELADGSYFSAIVRDLSTTGLFVVTKRTLEIGTIVGLALALPDSPTPVRVDAKLVRRADAGYGLAFVEPSPEIVAAIGALTQVGS